MPPISHKHTLPCGEVVDLFYIGSLASALGRTPNTVRKWEIGGIIPKSGFKDKTGSRLYTRDQIDAIVRCAERAKIVQGSSIANTSFSTWCYKEFGDLAKKYVGGNPNAKTPA